MDLSSYKSGTVSVFKTSGYLPAIKALKDWSGCDLRDAKETVDLWKMQVKEDDTQKLITCLEEKNKKLSEALLKILDIVKIEALNERYPVQYDEAIEALKEYSAI